VQDGKSLLLTRRRPLRTAGLLRRCFLTFSMRTFLVVAPPMRFPREPHQPIDCRRLAVLEDRADPGATLTPSLQRLHAYIPCDLSLHHSVVGLASLLMI
jgi:hypothetical protein